MPIFKPKRVKRRMSSGYAYRCAIGVERGIKRDALVIRREGGKQIVGLLPAGAHVVSVRVHRTRITGLMTTGQRFVADARRAP